MPETDNARDAVAEWRAALGADQVWTDDSRIAPVSYTHLTLPTIYSV